MVVWIAGYSVETLFAYWICLRGGADWLEGTFTSGFLVNFFAPRWSADGIKLFVGLSWVVATIAFVLGLFSPEVRSMVGL